MQALEKRVRMEEVWRDMLLTSNGRDKAFVSVAFSSRAFKYLYDLRNSFNIPFVSVSLSTLH